MGRMMGERIMWAAVVERARLDVLGSKLYGEDPGLARAAALAWTETDDFDEVCHLAGLEPHETRHAMRMEAGLG